MAALAADQLRTRRHAPAGGVVMGAGTQSTRLAPRDADRLAELEITIAHGLTTFVEVGAALAEVRESRLYRAEHPTFEDYCRVRWGMSRPRAYQLIEAATVVGGLSTTVDTPLPATESQARSLTKLPPEQQREAWSEAVETAPKNEAGQPKVTAAHVASVVEKKQRDVSVRVEVVELTTRQEQVARAHKRRMITALATIQGTTQGFEQTLDVEKIASVCDGYELAEWANQARAGAAALRRIAQALEARR